MVKDVLGRTQDGPCVGRRAPACIEALDISGVLASDMPPVE